MNKLSQSILELLESKKNNSRSVHQIAYFNNRIMHLKRTIEEANKNEDKACQSRYSD